MKKTMILAWCAITAAVAFAEPTVTNAKAQQRYPWNGKVDITFDVSGVEEGGSAILSVTTTNMTTGTEIPMTDVKDFATGQTVSTVSNGSYHLVWDSSSDSSGARLPDVKTFVEVSPYNQLGNAPSGCNGVQLWQDGPYWAEMNIGATTETEDGLYFWWGDTVGYTTNSTGKFDIRFDTALATNGKTNDDLIKEGWCESKNGKTVLKPEHDAAHMKWGGDWRIPTDSEIEMLTNNTTYCVCKADTVNGVKGCRVTGVQEGYTDKSIFLPAAGIGEDTNLNSNGVRGYYMSSVHLSYPNAQNTTIYNKCVLFYFSYYDGFRFESFERDPCYGWSIRAVR